MTSDRADEPWLSDEPWPDAGPPAAGDRSAPAAEPPRPGKASRRRLAWGPRLELFGAPASPWRGLLLPLPWCAAVLQVLLLRLGASPQWPAFGTHLAEALWLLWAPFVLATGGHVVGRGLTHLVFRLTGGSRHLDTSPRRSHYAVAFALAAAPLVAVQLHLPALDAYMTLRFELMQRFFPGSVVYFGYTPDWANLWVLGVFPLVWWQASRLVAAIPPGRLLGLQRELARLRGELAWGPEAWGATVGEVVDRWLADLSPGVGEAPEAGESRRRHRQRWVVLRRELVAAWVGSPPDLPRANRAIELFRSGRAG